MLEDLFGNLQKQQEDMQQKLSAMLVEAEAGDGAVTVKAGADMHLQNIKFDLSKIDLTDAEQLEDLVLEAVNRVLELAREKASVESGKLLQQMMPGGDFGSMFQP